MPALQFEYEVLMEDGTKYQVVTDQRDIAAWEVQEFAVPFREVGERINLFLRYTAWHALKERRGEIDLSWKDFSKQCVEVADLSALGDDEPAGQVDPTTQDQSAGA